MTPSEGRWTVGAVPPHTRDVIPAISPIKSRVAGSLHVVMLGVILFAASVANGYAELIVAGLSSSPIDPEIKGQVLIEEVNCAACHAGSASLSARSKKAPRLSEVGSRANPAYLQSFIRDPHGIKPGTTMPDLLAPLGSPDKAEVATSLTHFLMSLKTNDFVLQPPDPVAAKQGKRLFHSRGCAACHSPRDDRGAELLPGSSVPLGALEKKYSFRSLVDFLRRPHATRSSGRMPDLRLSGRDLERITHFLLQDTRVPGSLSYTLHRGQVWEGFGSEEVRAERGGQVSDFSLGSLGTVEHHTAIQYHGWLSLPRKGRHTFFLVMNGGALVVDGKELIRQEPSDRRGVVELEAGVELEPGQHEVRLDYFHTGHSPRFVCEMQGPGFDRQAIPSSMLSVASEPVPALQPFLVDAGLAARGREQFGKLGCANCHDDLGVPPRSSPAYATLDASRGCLGETPGPWPRFDLNAEQRGWIRTALPRAQEPQLDDLQRLNKTLVTFNCIACHERAGLGGVSTERLSIFTGTQPTLGDQGRLPPPLSHVGAKLTPDWIAEVLLRGGRQRDYVDASMPQFGEANVGHLVELFGKVDSLEAAPIPKVGKPQEFREAGHQMVGSTGLSCIACHEFNGQKPGETSALDLARVTRRLKKNWFHLYLRQPARFHPTVIMPSYWPDGQSTRPDILGGDVAEQIEALWTYLDDGPRAKKPTGLSRESGEIRVGDVTEVCRGQSPIGYRGIGVGYPERLNLAFDAGEMSLRQLWKGDFASVGLGHFHPKGTELITFPPGIPFHRLKSLEENWPYKGKLNHAFPQDHGYQFRGYHLDSQRRPTLLYRYGEIAVEDFFEDLRGKDGKAYFRRTIRFETPTEQAPFYFRAAAGRKIVAQSDRSFRIDQLELRADGPYKGIVREGENGEVLIPVTLPKGRTVLTVEYQW